MNVLNKDAIIFNLLYTKKNSTYEIAAANLNNFNVIINKNKNTVSRQALENRNNNISNDQYKNIYDNISKYINIHFYKEKYKYQIFAVDGSNINLKKSFSNNGYKLNKNKQSVTALNLGIYNITRNYPIILELVNHKNERKSFQKHLKMIYLYLIVDFIVMN